MKEFHKVKEIESALLLQRVKPGPMGKNDWEADFGLRQNLLAQWELTGGGMATLGTYRQSGVGGYCWEVAQGCSSD